METLPLYEGARQVGTVRWAREGLYIHVEAAAERRAGICRAYLRCENGEKLLGVLEPEGELLRCERRFAAQQLRSLGPFLAGELRQAGDDGWRPFAGGLGAYWDGRLAGTEGALVREEGARRLLAVPLDAARAFPLMELFCLAEPRDIGGSPCAVFAFSSGNEPLPPEA